MSDEMYSRIRGSKELKLNKSTYSWTENGGTTHYGPYDYVSSGEGSVMKDVYAKYGDARWPFKPCESQKVQFSRSLKTLEYYRVPDCHFYDYPNLNWGNGAFLVPIPPSIEGRLPVTPDGVLSDSWKDLPQHNWERLANRFQNELPSLGSECPEYYVFLSEIRDVLTTFDFVKAKTLLDKVANGFLAWSFGVAPTIGELKATSGVISRVYDHIADLRDGAGKVHTTQSHVVLSETDVYDEADYCPFHSTRLCGSHSLWRHKTDRRIILGVTAKYRYHFPEYMYDIVAKMMPVLSAFNLVPNISTNWEMFPFSFVVDWLVNTEKVFRMSQLQDPHDVQIDIIDLCVTEKVIQTDVVEFNAPCFSETGIIFESILSHFQRTTGTNALNSRIPWIKIPTFMQFTLGAALGWTTGLIPRFKK